MVGGMRGSVISLKVMPSVSQIWSMVFHMNSSWAGFGIRLFFVGEHATHGGISKTRRVQKAEQIQISITWRHAIMSSRLSRRRSALSSNDELKIRFVGRLRHLNPVDPGLRGVSERARSGIREKFLFFYVDGFAARILRRRWGSVRTGTEREGKKTKMLAGSLSLGR